MLTSLARRDTNRGSGKPVTPPIVAAQTAALGSSARCNKMISPANPNTLKGRLF
jgi:hypothetical protein